jgi:hypothetical protein
MTVLSALDFPRWTRARLGLPTTADLAEEIDRHILRAEDHVRSLIGDVDFDRLADVDVANADTRRRFRTALVDLVESMLYAVTSETLGLQIGSSTQGSRSRTVTADAKKSADGSVARSHRSYVEGMFRLGFTVDPRAVNAFHTEMSR